MTDEAWKDSTVEAWAQMVIDDMAPKMKESKVAISLAPKPDSEWSTGDVKLWVETGAMLWMDKPVVLIAQEGQVLPTRLEKIADEIVRIPAGEGIGPEASERLAEALDRLAPK